VRFSRTFPDGIASESHHPQQVAQFTFPPENGTLRIAATTFEWSDIPLVDADGAASAAAVKKRCAQGSFQPILVDFRFCDL